MSAARVRILGLTSLCVVSWVACSPASRGRPQAAAPAPREVTTGRSVLRPMERVVLATGGLLAQEQATLSVKVPGRLTVLAVDMGSQVQTGDLIAQIEPRDYELRVNQAAAALAQARAVLGLPLEGDDDRMHLEATSPVRQAQAVLGEVQANRDRVLRLTEQGISSPSERDTVEAAYQVAQSRYEAALDEARTRQAALSQRRAELDLARKQLSDTAVRAPFGGSVQARIANLGEYVATGSPVVRLVRTDPLRLRLDVAETDAHAVRIGQLARFTVVGTSNQIEVRVTRLSPALQERSRMLVAEADVPNNGSLRAGSFVRGQVVVGNDDEGVAIPPAALVVFAGLEKVLLVREGKAIEQPVATGRSGAGWIEIVSGLAAGQEVILNPGNLQTGQAVSLPAASATAPQAADGTDRSEVPPSSGGAR